jgi:hypothetical protein
MKRTRDEKPPGCFGDLDAVFPVAEEGLRTTPESCLPCPLKTECLREAMHGPKGLRVREEIVDRAYRSRMIGFIERWSRKKSLRRRIEERPKCKPKGREE